MSQSFVFCHVRVLSVHEGENTQKSVFGRPLPGFGLVSKPGFTLQSAILVYKIDVFIGISN